MKKILLATTLLAASSTVAMADAHLAWGGSAAAGIASSGADGQAVADLNARDDDNFHAYANASVNLTLSGATDGGLTFGAGFGATTGVTYALADDDGFGDEAGDFGGPTVFISGSFGKLEFSDDNFDFADDSTTGDVKYSGKFGMFGVGVIADIESGEMGFNTDFAIGAISVTASADTVDHFDVGASFKVSDAITVSASTDENSDAVVGAAMTFGSISASADFNTSDESIDLAAGYAANGLSVDFSTNTVSSAYTVTIGYDLGGGLALEAGTNDVGDMQVGATMAF
jgi:hypothetical protein